ncbi:hypothetical protein [Horticoccus sp. 23ND18S-11]|uniref:hypothetical protein n=1 Tax=Horticoccus sp. 23ND18S-11 TaxID=3391832 RepID=UPI0039C93BF1
MIAQLNRPLAAPAAQPTPPSSWLRRFVDSLFPEVGGEIEVCIRENSRGGFSIYPANEAALALFAPPPGLPPEDFAEAGNFGTYADAYKRAHRDNCWTVVESS